MLHGMENGSVVAEEVFDEQPSARRQLISAAEFRQLAISCRRLLRYDLPQEGLYGLLDPAEGVLYVTSSDDLFV